MKAAKPTPTTLHFRSADKEVSESIEDLSAVISIGSDLWLASDETTCLERLSKVDDKNYDSHQTEPLDPFIELPAGDKEEIDIEGLDYDQGYLWLTGSHSLKREKADLEDQSKSDAIKRLAGMVRETNRYLIARIPVLVDPKTGGTQLCKSIPNPEDPSRPRTAAQLFGTGHENMLTAALRHDEHLGRFLSIPCKENGFDIEGLAVHGGRVFLGLRGPVLGGWAVILEIELEEVSPSVLRLRPIGSKGALYKKHFFDLDGLGIRDLCTSGDALLILAGPTMDLDGHVIIYRWSKLPKRKKEAIVPTGKLESVLEFKFSTDHSPGMDHAEGMTVMKRGQRASALIIYDGPARKRLPGNNRLMVDSFQIDT